MLLKELQSLCLNVEVLSTVGTPMELSGSDDDDMDSPSLGINLSRDERSDADNIA